MRLRSLARRPLGRRYRRKMWRRWRRSWRRRRMSAATSHREIALVPISWTLGSRTSPQLPSRACVGFLCCRRTEAHRPAPPPAAFARAGVDPHRDCCTSTSTSPTSSPASQPTLASGCHASSAPASTGSSARRTDIGRRLRDGLLCPPPPARRRRRRHVRGMPIFFEGNDGGCRGDMLRCVFLLQSSCTDFFFTRVGEHTYYEGPRYFTGQSFHLRAARSIHPGKWI